MFNRTNDVALFKRNYGKSPQEMGFFFVEIYDRQKAFLYATSSEVIKAYKLQHRINCWIASHLFYPLLFAFLLLLASYFIFQTLVSPLSVLIYIFFTVWIMLFLVLSYKEKTTCKKIKFGENFIILHY